MPNLGVNECKKNHIILKILENTVIECFFRWHIKTQDYCMEVGVSLSEFHVTLFWKLGTGAD